MCVATAAYLSTAFHPPNDLDATVLGLSVISGDFFASCDYIDDFSINAHSKLFTVRLYDFAFSSVFQIDM